MKLSEAIRLGSMLKPQGFGPMSRRRGDEACAIQAAMLAVNGDATIDGCHTSARLQFAIMDVGHACPVLGCWASNPDVGHAIWHINDNLRWTREAIADWVESIENAQSDLEETPCSPLQTTS